MSLKYPGNGNPQSNTITPEPTQLVTICHFKTLSGHLIGVSMQLESLKEYEAALVLKKHGEELLKYREGYISKLMDKVKLASAGTSDITLPPKR